MSNKSHLWYPVKPPLHSLHPYEIPKTWLGGELGDSCWRVQFEARISSIAGTIASFHFIFIPSWKYPMSHCSIFCSHIKDCFAEVSGMYPNRLYIDSFCSDFRHLPVDCWGSTAHIHYYPASSENLKPWQWSRQVRKDHWKSASCCGGCVTRIKGIRRRFREGFESHTKYVPHLNAKTSMGLKAVLRLLLILMQHESSLMQNIGTTHESCHMSLVTTMCLATDIDDQTIKITMLRMWEK